MKKKREMNGKKSLVYKTKNIDFQSLQHKREKRDYIEKRRDKLFRKERGVYKHTFA
jgi:hypothetical protein